MNERLLNNKRVYKILCKDVLQSISNNNDNDVTGKV